MCSVAIQITRQYSRSPIQYSNRASSTTHILLWSAVIANVFNFLYFWDLETDTSGTAEFLLLIIVLNYLLMRVHSGCKGLIPKFLQVRMKRAHLRKLQGQEWAEEGSDVRPLPPRPEPPALLVALLVAFNALTDALRRCRRTRRRGGRISSTGRPTQRRWRSA